MTDNNIQGKVLFPLLKLLPFFPNLSLAFIFLQRKKINALQVLKRFPPKVNHIAFIYLPVLGTERFVLRSIVK